MPAVSLADLTNQNQASDSEQRPNIFGVVIEKDQRLNFFRQVTE